MQEGTWAVLYQDGTIQAQYDKDSLGFMPIEGHPAGGEVPFRAIEWDRADSVIFHSAEDTASYKVAHDPQWKVSLRSRVFQRVNGAIRCFILLVSKPGEEVSETTEAAIYWFPNGVTHQCFQFDCEQVRHFGSKAAAGIREGLMPMHDRLQVTVDAILE